MRARLILIVWLWAIMPVLMVVLNKTLGLRSDPVFFALLLGTCSLIYHSGQSWKESSRVQELLDEGESPVVVFPARRPHTAAPWRTVRGCFVVLTERRVLVFTYNKLLDIPTGVLLVADRSESSAELRVDGRLLTVTSQGTGTAFGVAERRRTATAHFVSALGA